MTELTAWLLERIAEEQREAEECSPSPWVIGHDFEKVENRDGWVADGWASDVRLFVRWSPARVLAECAAHRAIVAEHAPIEVYREQPLVCATCVKVDEGGSYITTDTEDVFPCPTIRALASIYADHPGFREEWL